MASLRLLGGGTASLIALALGLIPASAAADWLVTTRGELIETLGPWQLRGSRVVFRTPGGAVTAIRAVELDLAASRAYTQLAAAAPQLPRGWTQISPPPPRIALVAPEGVADQAAGDKGPVEVPEEVKERRRELAEVEDAERPERAIARLLFGRPLILSGGYDVSARYDDDLRPAGARADGRATLRQRLELELYYQAWPKIALFLEADVAYRSALSSQDQARSVEDLEVRAGDAWLHLANIGGSRFDLQLGRQTLYDRRGWWWSGQLDALRLSYDRRNFELQLALAQGFTALELDRRELDLDGENLLRALGSSSWRYLRNHWLELFALVERDRSPSPPVGAIVPAREADGGDADLHWLGTRLIGRHDRPGGLVLQYWLDAALLRGRETLLDLERIDSETRRVDGIREGKLRSGALDAGLSLTAPWAGRPTLTLGFAAGSGPRPEDAEIDRAFRQTDLHSNYGRFQGVHGFRYYGELLDPELSNLAVWTVGLGFRFLDSSSLEIVAHSYRQLEPAPFLRRSRLRSRPDGASPEIGEELDLVLGIQEWEHARFRLFGSVFRPGAAFGPPPREPLYGGRAQIQLVF